MPCPSWGSVELTGFPQLFGAMTHTVPDVCENTSKDWPQWRAHGLFAGWLVWWGKICACPGRWWLEDVEMIGQKKKKKSSALNVNLPMAWNEQSTQTMLPLTTLFYSFFAKCCGFHIIFFSLIEPPKTEMLYVYIVCVHIQNHGVVECSYLPFSTQWWGLVCCEINQKFKTTTTQYCCSILNHPLSVVSLPN